ncbi:MAG TPA: hypothetical protein VMV49_04410 [Candidatus Deferrimicrobium sp.]|nr:hypothetical protein [Candidatus Deferrimicrobium sp.]
MEGEEKAKSLLQEFNAVEENFKLIEDNISNIKKLIESLLLKSEHPKAPLKNIGVADLIELPEELRKSVIAVMKSGSGTVEEVVARTRRDMNLEKGYLEALVAMEYLRKESNENESVGYRLGLGKRKSKLSDDIWKILIKDSSDMISFICKMEIEKAQLKRYDIDEMLQMAPQAQNDLNSIKQEINRYIEALENIITKY